MSRRLALIALVVVVAVVSHGSTVAAQAPVHAKCRDAHALPTCGSYFLFELSGTARISGSSIGRCDFTCTVENPLPGYGSVDIGWMRNVDTTRALGGSLQIGGSDQGTRLALRIRHRSWLPHGFTFDAGAGPLLEARGGGVTGDIALGRARIGSLMLGQDIARQYGEVVTGTHAGARLESTGGAIGSLLIAGMAVGLVIAIGSAGGR